MSEKLIRCPFCAASSEDTPEQAWKAMRGCNNCRIDLSLKGEWTGTAWAIVKAIRGRSQAAEVKP